MSRRLYYCCVAGCVTTSREGKLFFTAPMDPERRTLWFNAIKRDMKRFSEKTSVQVCEDHFNLEQDLENYVRFRYYPETRRKILRKNVVPHIFNCQPEMVTVKDKMIQTEEMFEQNVVVKEEMNLNEQQTREVVSTFESSPKSTESFCNLLESEWLSVMHSQDHILSGASHMIYHCEQCSYQASWPFEVAHHVKLVHKNTCNAELHAGITELEQFLCVCCDFNSCYKLSLFKHCKYEHNVRSDGTENEKQDLSEQFFNDEFCSKLSLLKRNVLSEMTSDPSETDAKEDVGIKKDNMAEDFASCTVKNEVGFEQHVMGRATEHDWFKCEQCSYKSKHKKNMNRHKSTCHEINRRYHCAENSFTTKYHHSLKAHVFKHASPQDSVWLSCTHCSYKAQRKSQMNRHVMLTRADKPSLKCLHCSFQTKHDCTLKAHMLNHAADLKRCSQCSFTTKHAKSLRTHRLQHAKPEEIAWVQCPRCSYRCKLKFAMKSHMLTHETTENDWLKCTKCLYRSTNKANLRRHLLKIHGTIEEVGTLRCRECSYLTRSRYHLKAHLLNTHGLVEV